jgi:hypothetical protein
MSTMAVAILLTVTFSSWRTAASAPPKDVGVPVTGTVRVSDTILLTAGAVEFIPEMRDEPVPISEIKEGGRFALWTFREGDGAKPGTYKVVIRDAVPAIDSRYADEATTDLRATIERGKKNEFLFVLKPAK